MDSDPLVKVRLVPAANPFRSAVKSTSACTWQRRG